MASAQQSAIGSNPTRKRSLQACLSCRSRKVRCDVSLHGQPCTNCTLDEKQCRVPDAINRCSQAKSKAKRRASQQIRDSIIVDNTAANSVTTKDSDFFDSMMIPKTASSLDPSSWASGYMDSLDFNDALPPTPKELYGFSSSGEPASLSSWFVNASGAGPFLPMASTAIPLERPLKADGGLVIYSHYRFLTAGNIHAIPHQDVSYLEAQGCLHVPITPILDVFMSKYFTHIHLFLPLIDEGDFWDMYSPSSQSPSKDTISLVVLHAILFASCNYVPIEYLTQLGYSDIRTARADLYRKTKLLYDHEVETSHLPLAQAALLLMNWVANFSTNTSHNPWKTWHGLALRHAEHINAHRCGKVADVSSLASPAQKRYFRSVRRLWWCCIIMDRLSPLCTRFRSQITPDLFGLDAYVPLGFNDFQPEIHRSRVFGPAMKRRHITLFAKFLDLVLILTDVLSIAFPYESKVEINPETTQGSDIQVEKCRCLLRAWYESAIVDFPLFEGQNQDRHVEIGDPANSIILYTSLMYMYYHTACITLCNYRIFNQLSLSGSSAIHPGTDDVAIQAGEICGDVECSALGLTRCVGALTSFRLIHCLPVVALACIGTPLALQLITARLSSLKRELALDSTDQWSEKGPVSNRSRLDVLIKATDAFLPYYYGVDWIKETAKHAADLAQAYNQRLTQSDREAVTDWGHILIKNPDTYLRLIWTVDLCISRGKLPEDQDFPLYLRNVSNEAQRGSPEFRDKLDVCHHLDGLSEGSSSDLDRLLGLADTTAEPSWDDMMLFENEFDKAAESIPV